MAVLARPISALNRPLAFQACSRRALAPLRPRFVSNAAKPPTAVVMMNMGGPSTVGEVNDFLTRLFNDNDLIPLPFQSILGPLIAKRRTPTIEEQYASIGGGSPILKWTQIQGAGMCALLDELNPESAPHKPYVAFRYAKTLTETTLAAMKADGVKRAVAFSQYPQYSCSTTGSSLNELYRVAKQEKWGGAGEVEWSVIDRWPTHPGLVEAFAHNIKTALKAYPEQDRNNVTILFSAHSLPLEIVNRGDPYTAEVAATVWAIMQKLNFSNPWRLTWQSKVGPKAWQGPQTAASIEGYAKQGQKNICLVPVAFTSDHIETLFELDQEVAEDAEKLGVHLTRAASLNDNPIFIRALADIVSTHLNDYDAGLIGPASQQLLSRCQMSKNPRSEATKKWLGSGGKNMVY
ncbi:ferrochelatase [Cryptococcus wingfieldii CBS 7118]|uniref:Ferrochelatase n=2 Tax=Cryptococcus TaxID=5206 RepID=A0A1E3JZ45_9TREE|nr:ferrochelatase [Cryptococcus wingfieldii CBS 7118]ODO06148.1 ferrochelatase [Cryptococcus wingfieldii CBS 7118]TYJ57685.1 ferrochelatase [Cryptococcus floricola]